MNMARFTIPTLTLECASDDENDVATSENESVTTPRLVLVGLQEKDQVPPGRDQKVTTSEEMVTSQGRFKVNVGAMAAGKERDSYNLQNGQVNEDSSGEYRPNLRRKRGLSPKNILELKFVESIRRGDVQEVEATMKIDPRLHRLEDFFGRSALEHGIASGSLEIVRSLLDHCSSFPMWQQAMERAMLYTIKENDLVLMDGLLTIYQDTIDKRKQGDPRLSVHSGDSASTTHAKKNLDNALSLDMFDEDAEFSQPEFDLHKLPHWKQVLNSFDEPYSDIKPMVLAAQLNRVEMVEMLYQRLPQIIHPLTQGKCSDQRECLVCSLQVSFVGRQSIEDCRRAMDMFKALSSPAFLFHSGTEDSILEAFIISDLMEKRMIIDPAYYKEYRNISQQCRRFSTTLLGLCRSMDEVQTLFYANGGIERSHRPKYHRVRFPRLLLALHFHQKEFVAHSHCQQLMQNEWYDCLPDWVCRLKQHELRLAAYTTLLFIFMPVIVILYLFRVKGVERFVKPATNKFILDMCSFFYFLVMLFIKVSFGLFSERGKSLYPLDWLIFIWVIGQTVRYVNKCLRRKDHCNIYWGKMENSNWHFFELITLTCFWLQYLLLIGMWIHLSLQEESPALNREQLNGGDPFLLSELFGAIASCLTVGNLYAYFKVNSSLGPLQVSLKNIIFDVLKVMVFFLVVWSAFSLGLTSIYSGYLGITVIDPKTLDEVVQEQAFTNILSAYKRLFWDLFNYGNEDYAMLVMGNSPIDHTVNVSDSNGTSHLVVTSHRPTELIGFILYGAYHITVIIVLLNMLIAMMANSYNNIEANSDTEWKFARTRLFMNYFNEVGVLCPPFNLVPVRAILALLAKKFECCRVFQREPSEIKQRDIQTLMGRLRKRYWKLQLAKQKSKLQPINSKGNPVDDGERTPSLRERKFTWSLPKNASTAESDGGSDAGTQVAGVNNSPIVLKLANDTTMQTSIL